MLELAEGALAMKKPKPNGKPVKMKGGCTVELSICSCCKDDSKTKRRYFVRDKNGTLIGMALCWENVGKIAVG